MVIRVKIVQVAAFAFQTSLHPTVFVSDTQISKWASLSAVLIAPINLAATISKQTNPKAILGATADSGCQQQSVNYGNI